MLFTAFIFGALGSALALIVEIVVLGIDSGVDFMTATPHLGSFVLITCAVLIEEATRFLFLFQFHRRFLTTASSKVALFWYGLGYGLGYAALEIALILSQYQAPASALGRIIMIHTLLSLLYLFSLSGKLRFSPTWVIALGIATHLFFNLALLYTGK